MPLCTLALVAALGSLVPLPPMLVVVMILESATPTANNLMMMSELAGGGASEFISTVIFAQYLAARDYAAEWAADGSDRRVAFTSIEFRIRNGSEFSRRKSAMFLTGR